MSERVDLSVIIPVYNASQSLPELLERLEAVLKECCTQFEAVLVNDGSADESWETIEILAGQYAWLRGIDLTRNSGQHNALLCGIRAARYDLLVTIDDDCQNPPEEIPAMLAALDGEHDIVYGVPDKRGHGLYRRIGSYLLRYSLKIGMGVEDAPDLSAFRLLRTRLRDSFADYNAPFVTLDVLFFWSTTRVKAIRVRHDERRYGRSNYTFLDLIGAALTAVTGYSTLPLRLSSLVGFGFTLFGLSTLIWVLTGYLIFGRAVPGFAFLASVVVIFSGIQLLILGIFGEFLARIHMRSMDKPPYTIRSETSGPVAR